MVFKEQVKWSRLWLLPMVVIGLFGVFHLGQGLRAKQRSNRVQPLAKPVQSGKMSLEEAISKRRSVRAYQNRDLKASQISQLLFAAQGITSSRHGFRAAPSAGATYPLETYLVSSRGVFRYLPESHTLKILQNTDRRNQLASASLGQACVRNAPISLVFTAVWSRTTGRYGRRGKMYVHMEAGHAAQNVHLQAVALELGSVPVGAFDPDQVSEVIQAPKDEEPIYIIPVGHPVR